MPVNQRDPSVFINCGGRPAPHAVAEELRTLLRIKDFQRRPILVIFPGGPVLLFACLLSRREMAVWCCTSAAPLLRAVQCCGWGAGGAAGRHPAAPHPRRQRLPCRQRWPWDGLPSWLAARLRDKRALEWAAAQAELGLPDPGAAQPKPQGSWGIFQPRSLAAPRPAGGRRAAITLGPTPAAAKPGWVYPGRARPAAVMPAPPERLVRGGSPSASGWWTGAGPSRPAAPTALPPHRLGQKERVTRTATTSYPAGPVRLRAMLTWPNGNRDACTWHDILKTDGHFTLSSCRRPRAKAKWITRI